MRLLIGLCSDGNKGTEKTIPCTSSEPIISLDLNITQLFAFRTRVYCSVVCSIIFLANPARRYERCMAPGKKTKKNNGKEGVSLLQVLHSPFFLS